MAINGMLVTMIGTPAEIMPIPRCSGSPVLAGAGAGPTAGAGGAAGAIATAIARIVLIP